MKSKSGLLFLFLVIFTTGKALAGSFALVDMERVYKEYWKQQQEQKSVQQSQIQLQQFTQLAQQQAMPVIEERNTLGVELQNADTTEERKTEINQRLTEIQNELMKKQGEVNAAQARHQQRVNEYQTTIRKDVDAVIEMLARQKNISNVFTKSSMVYAEVDLTDSVIEELNKSAPAE